MSPSRAPQDPDLRNRALGAHGEALAAKWYETRGYEVLARNWRCPEGELDLVLGGDGVIVFCEVKTRSSDRFGLPAEAVTAGKQRRIRRLALSWLDDAGRRAGRVRFDVACVVGGRVEVIESAF